MMKHTVWKQISKTLLLKHPRMSVYEDEVELPGGHRTSYIHIEHAADSSAVIARNKDGKILVQREYSYPPNEWLYQFPGGKIEHNETPKQAAHRELAEEAGLQGKLTKLGWYYLDNRRQSNKQYVYLAQELSDATAEADAEEDIESYWFSEAEINQMISLGTFVNSTALAAWAFYTACKL